MKTTDLELRRFSTRTLNLLAQVFSGAEARVILSDRAVHPLTVALASRTIVLNPNMAGLFDLALGSLLVLQRPLLSKGPTEPQRKDRWLTLKVMRGLGADAQRELERRFPRIDQLPGRFQRGSDLSTLRLVENAVEYEPLVRSSGMTPDGRTGNHTLQASEIPELEITGADEDFSWIVQSIQDRAISLETLPHLDDLPFCRIPLKVESAQRFALLEEWEEQLADGENQESIASLMKCHRDKAVIRDQRKQAGRHSLSGIHLDANRLADAVARARAGLPTAVFRKPASIIEPAFDPDQFLTVVTFDLNDLRDLSWTGNRSAVLRFLAVLLTCFQRLGVNLVVQGTADQLLTLDDGRTVCLHFTTVLKAVHDSFEHVLLPRLACLMKQPPRLPGQAGCYHALSVEDIRRQFRLAEPEGDFTFCTQVWWSRHLLDDSHPRYREESFLQRSADHVDFVMSELKRDLSHGTLDTLASFLPRELKQLGRPGGYLQTIQF